ncbi:MAG: CHASE domain-containing protein [Sulfuricurvum sp.]|nr:CHASE domain-containing protein [Sulfuricurvum sp.]
MFSNKPKTFSLSRFLILLILIFSLIIAYFVWSLSKTFYDNRAQELFEAKVQTNVDHIEKRILMYENVLRSGVAFFQGSDNVSRQEWHQFTQTLDIPKYYPGMQGIGYSLMIDSGQISHIEHQMRIEGYPNFILKPKGIREQYSSILYLEPMDKRNIQAIGYDMYSNPVRRLAMERARDTGLASASAPVKLVQEIDSNVQPGILMYLPFYKTGAKTDTVQERQKALVGYVYSPYRMNNLLNVIVPQDSIVNYEIYDGEKKIASNLLYRSFTPTYYISKHHTHKVINVSGRQWHLYLNSTQEFDHITDSKHPILLTLGGILIYFILVIIIIILYRNYKKLKKHSIQMQLIENALRQEKETAQNYLDIVDVLIVVLDTNKNVKLINRRGCEILGYTFDEIIGKNWINNFLPKRFQEEVNNVSKRLELSDKTAYYYENPVLTKDGDERIIAWHNTPLFDQNNKFIGILCSGEDITEIREAQNQLIESEQFYKTIVSSMDKAIFILDKNIIIDCNPIALSLFNSSKKELIGNNILYLSDHIECGNQNFEQYLQNAYAGHLTRVQCSYVLDGEIKNVKILDITLSSFGNNAEKLIMLVRDITQKLEEERFFKMHTRQAQMGEMISMIAHQWRQPLAIINAITSQLRLKEMMKENEDADFIEDLIKIEQQSVHLSQTITAYRDFFRPNKPKETVSILDIVNQTVDLVDHALKSKGVDLQIVIIHNTNITIYRNEVLQVLITLFKNALDAFEDQNIINRKIIVTVDSDNQYAIITILDNAGGIPTDIIDKIFIPYFSTKHENIGTGLGLYMSKMIIEDHCNGKLEAYNHSDGASFVIKLLLDEKKDI